MDNKIINTKNNKEKGNAKGGLFGDLFYKEFNMLMLKSSSIMEILIMIISIIAFAYFVSEPIQIAKAQVNAGCCEKTKNNAVCQNVFQEQCQDGFSLGVLCEQTANCKLGCCISPQGNCVVNTPKKACQESGGAWHDSENCGISECQRGCCVLGIQTQFITEKECETISRFYGLEKDFRKQMTTELECLALSYQTKEAACIFTINEQETCQYKTQQECNRVGGRIEFGKYCSDVLEKCQKHFEKKCIDGKDEVYWFDSCGIKEDVAESCDRFKGTTCGYNEKGEAYCRDLDCHDIPSKINGGRSERKNGESWCVYESYIGDGKDVPGTNHYKYYCHDGIVKKQTCREGRAEICAENEVTREDGTKFSQAQCVPNNALSCINLNIQKFDNEITEEEFIEKCQNNTYCQIQNISSKKEIPVIGKAPVIRKKVVEGLNPALKLCAPKYPLGLTNPDDASFICSFGTYKCTKVEIKEIGGWDTKAGADCGSEETKKMANEFCMSFGDCGIHTNIEGKVTYGGLKIKKEVVKNDKSEGISSVENPNLRYLSQYKNHVLGQKVLMQEILSYIEDLIGELTLPSPEAWEAESSEALKWLGGIGLLGAAGIGIAAIGGFGEGVQLATWATQASKLSPGVGASYVLIGMAIGGILGSLLGKWLGYGPDTTTFLTIIGAVAGGVLGWKVVLGKLTLKAAFNTLFWIFVVIIVILELFGVGDTRTTTYTYECRAWEPPAGGDDCELCNSKYNETCTAYKCWSLGTACKYDRQAGRCYKDIDDGRIPMISPWASLLSDSGFKIVETTSSGIRINKTDTWNGCVNQFEQVTLGITTHEEAVCKYDFSSKDFDDMIYDFDTSWNTNHSATRSFSVLEKGEQSIYIKCSDRQGHKNDIDYIVKMCINELDVSAPAIMFSSPQTDSYIKYKEDKVNLTIFLNEPAECRWSKVDKSFESMENNLTCPLIETMYLWPCQAEITGLKNESNDVYVRCKDKIGAPESERNTNTQGTKFTFLKTTSPLTANIISPLKGSEMTFGNVVDVELKAETSGGARGNAICKYSFTGYGTMTQFFKTGTTEHTQHFNLLGKGKHKVYVECLDSAGNKARNMTEFSIQFDKQAPKITRVYKRDNNLYIETDEDAVCTYSDRTCNFNFEDGIQMSGIEKEHYVEWKSGKTYYIKCKDLWGNYADGCNMLIRTI